MYNTLLLDLYVD